MCSDRSLPQGPCDGVRRAVQHHVGCETLSLHSAGLRWISRHRADSSASFRSLRSMEVNRFSVTSRRSAPSRRVAFDTRVGAYTSPRRWIESPAAHTHGHPQSLTVISHAANHNVNVRVFGIMVLNRNPFEFSSEILLHLLDQFASQARKSIRSRTPAKRSPSTTVIARRCQSASCPPMSTALLSLVNPRPQVVFKRCRFACE